MDKKTNKRAEKVLLGLAIASVIITFIEGQFYYTAEAYPNVVIRGMLIIQNIIRAFGFKSDIGIEDVAKILQENRSAAEIFINYVYLAAIFVAPYCTVAFMYEILKKLFHFRKRYQSSKYEGIIILGYNQEVKMLLEDYHKNREQFDRYRVHLVAGQISDDEEMQLLRDGVAVHKVDFLKLSDEELKYFFDQIKSHLAKKILFFEESSERNFSLYKMFHDQKAVAALSEDVKFFCRCENDGMKALMEDFHDNQSAFDMEIVSVPELRIRKTLQERTLHDYYSAHPTEQVPVQDWDVHLLIVGFGKLGQQILLQTMNQGVMSSTNKITIDVVDFDIEKKSSIFLNTFHEDYVEMDKDGIRISSDRADGAFQVRFHQMDIRYKQFFQLLKTYGAVQNGGGYTYAAICIEDEEISIHCLTEIQRYLKEYVPHPERVNVVIRMEMDKYMKTYLNNNRKTFQNVFAIADTKEVVTLRDLIHDKLDEDAKEFNRIYHGIRISDQSNADDSVQADVKMDHELERKKLWRDLKLFRRDSSRAAAQHAEIKEVIWKSMLKSESANEALEKLFGVNGALLKAQGSVWVYDDEDEFVQKQSDQQRYPYVSEMSRLEHRRWCYYMASRGWRSIQQGDEAKERSILDAEKKNACLCTWDDLVKVKKDTCKYDLMWLLKKYNEC